MILIKRRLGKEDAATISQPAPAAPSVVVLPLGESGREASKKKPCGRFLSNVNIHWLSRRGHTPGNCYEMTAVRQRSAVLRRVPESSGV